MIKNLLVGLVTFFVFLMIPVYVSAEADIMITVKNSFHEPQYNNILIHIEIDSVEPIQKVTAKVDDREVDFKRAYCADGRVNTYYLRCSFGAEFPLTGLKQGSKTLEITAVNTKGLYGGTFKAFVYDAPPQVQVTGVSANHLVENGRFKAIVSTRDELSIPVITVSLQTAEGVLIDRVTSRGSLDHEFDLSAYANQIVDYRVDVYDMEHILRYSSSYHLYVDPAHIIPEYNVDGWILDFDHTRILYLSHDQKLKIRNRADGEDTTINYDGPLDVLGKALLTPTGAIVNIYGEFYLWTTGTLTATGIQTGYWPQEYTLTLQEDGSYAYYDTGRMLIDTRTGEVTPYQDGMLELMVKRPDYQTNRGWIAATKPTTNGTKEVFLQSPRGTETQVTHWQGNPSIIALNEHGSMVISFESELYIYHPGDEQPEKLDRNFSEQDITSFYGGSWHLASEGTVYRLHTQSVKQPPFWSDPAGALTVSGVTYDSVQLQWQHAIDPAGVTKYSVWLGSELLNTVSGEVYSFHVSGLSGETTYTFSISAENSAGLVSEANPAITVTTHGRDSNEPLPAGMLSLQLKPGMLQAGRVAEITVRADQVSDLYAFSTKVQYDPSKLKLGQVLLAGDFGKEGETAILAKHANPEAGRVQLTGSLLGEQAGKSGSVPLVVLKFVVLQTGPTTVGLNPDTFIANSEGEAVKLTVPVQLHIRIGSKDFDGDGRVTLSDLIQIAGHYGKEALHGDNSVFDLNSNGQIDITDIQAVAAEAAAQSN